MNINLEIENSDTSVAGRIADFAAISLSVPYKLGFIYPNVKSSVSEIIYDCLQEPLEDEIFDTLLERYREH